MAIKVKLIVLANSKNTFNGKREGREIKTDNVRDGSEKGAER